MRSSARHNEREWYESNEAIRSVANVHSRRIQNTMHTSASGQVSEFRVRKGTRQGVEVSEARDARHKITADPSAHSIRHDKALPLHFVSESGIIALQIGQFFGRASCVFPIRLPGVLVYFIAAGRGKGVTCSVEGYIIMIRVVHVSTTLNACTYMSFNSNSLTSCSQPELKYLSLACSK
jgi:hypothetical protein